jgi:hypothetical protein
MCLAAGFTYLHFLVQDGAVIASDGYGVDYTVAALLQSQATAVDFRMEAVMGVLLSVPSAEAVALLDGGLLSDRKTCALMAQVLSEALSTLQVSVCGHTSGLPPRTELMSIG